MNISILCLLFLADSSSPLKFYSSGSSSFTLSGNSRIFLNRFPLGTPDYAPGKSVFTFNKESRK